MHQQEIVYRNYYNFCMQYLRLKMCKSIEFPAVVA